MKNENIEKITSNHVETGETYSSYAALCRKLEIPATTGEQRKCDQAFLQRYFMWEKIPGTNKLTITETYYDDPKIPEDGRKGIYTTHLNGLMQDMILSKPWDAINYTKRDMLLEMKLIPFGDITTFYTEAPLRYISKMNSLLSSAITQLGKKGYKIQPVTVYKEDGRILSKSDEKKFKNIWNYVLALFNVRSIIYIFLKEKAKDFWEELDDICEIEFGGKIREYVRIEIPEVDTDIQVDRTQFIEDVTALLYNNFSKKHHGIGKNHTLHAFQEEMKCLVERIA